MRLRDLGVTVGSLPTGPLNALTDVAGVRVGHCTVVAGEGPLVPGTGPVRTGVTVIQPRAGRARDEPCFAGCFTLNGNGDMTGLEWVREAGLLTTPVALTNTHSVGVVRDALIAEEVAERRADETYWCMPVVGETFDGTLSDVDGGHVTAEHVRRALAAATGGQVPEGAVGGGTGMICHELKGGIGTSSRVVPEAYGGFTVAALVQANHGIRERLCVDGYPVGRFLSRERLPSPYDAPGRAHGPAVGSIIVVLATDAPLPPHQCARLAKRATNGLARAGGGNEDGSGDIFLAFATGNGGIPVADYGAWHGIDFALRAVTGDVLTQLFLAAGEAVEEAIVNAIVAAETVVGCDGLTALGLAPDELLGALRATGWTPSAR
jgi:D-aminopeptidase